MSGATFHIDEPALVRDDPRLPIIALPYVGTVVTVRSELIEHPRITGRDCYEVECYDGARLWAATYLLQKLPPSDPAYLNFRADLLHDVGELLKLPRHVAHEALRPDVHPSIASMLDLVGQSPIQAAREALGK